MQPSLVRRLTLLTAAGLGIASAFASDFPAPYNSEPDPNAAPPPSTEALAMMALPEGFTSTLYAAEPDVQNPVAMAWDGRGRMWVAENYTYSERQVRFDEALRDRVLVLEDTDGDGRADQRKVFIDTVRVLTSVEVGRGGVWLMCPPQLLFVPDADGDDVPDGEPQVVLDGFTVAEANYHNFANGLRWGPDSWLYGRCGHSCPASVGAPGTPEAERVPMKGGIWRYHPGSGAFEVLCHGTTNPWGHDWDRHGELFFINTVNGHLWHGIPGAHFKESFGADPNPLVYDRLEMHADHWHFDTSGKWSDSRDGAADAFGGGHAHCGMMIYQGTLWPERFHNRLFTLNMHGFRTNVERLDREGSGYVGRHEPDIFLTKDKWFRGIDIRQGPDGAVYLLDWSDTGECHEHTGVHRTSGRIFRIQYGEGRSVALPDGIPPVGTVLDALADPDPWLDRQIRLRLAGAGEVTGDLAAALAQTARTESDPVAKLRAMWHLRAIGGAADWTLWLDDDNEHVRSWAIRFLTDAQPIDTLYGPVAHRMPAPLSEALLDRFVEMAREDKSGLVRLTLASTLQRLALEQRMPLGAALAARAEDAGDHNLPSIVWCGVSPLAKENPSALVDLARGSRWPDLVRWAARSLAEQIEKRPVPLNDLLSHAAKSDPEWAASVLAGTAEALQGWRKAPKPEAWDALVARFAGEGQDGRARLVRELGAVFGDGRALDEIKALVKDADADPTARKSALATLIESRPDDLRAICESLLDDRSLNAMAARGLALYDDPAIGAALAKRYPKFSAGDRPRLIETLVSRPAWAGALLAAIDAGTVPKQDLSAFHARQIASLGDEALRAELVRVWGEIRESAEDKRKLVEDWTAKLTPEVLAVADLSKGRQLYAGICGACHVMYGEGGKIGPDLTGSNRKDLGYLLENIADPGAVVGADYRMTVLTLSDGRVLSGVVSSENDRTLTLREAVGESVLEKSAVSKREVLSASMMPEGLLMAFDEVQVRDLIAYLMHPVQVPLPE
ncbi:MAG TPA: c-type cytochrome [Bacteroidia bacterium]|nr:c-type cytochrome [Bacteroidia bacterium]